MPFPYDLNVRRDIPAPPAKLWAILTDYEDKHKRILPNDFEDYVIERGGLGDGTVLRCTVKAFGQKIKLHMTISEPQAGRILRETLDDGTVTEFVLDARDNGTSVQIRTTAPGKSGPRGWLEAKMAPGNLRKMYAKELENLEREAAA